MNRKKVISVCGGHKDTKFSADAYELGKGIALRGYVLITGGGGGIMESASRGAAENGGLVIGILPSERKAPLDGYPNPYVTIPVYTGMSDARNAIIAKSPDVLVALGGGCGDALRDRPCREERDAGHHNRGYRIQAARGDGLHFRRLSRFRPARD